MSLWFVFFGYFNIFNTAAFDAVQIVVLLKSIIPGPYNSLYHCCSFLIVEPFSSVLSSTSSLVKVSGNEINIIFCWNKFFCSLLAFLQIWSGVQVCAHFLADLKIPPFPVQETASHRYYAFTLYSWSLVNGIKFCIFVNPNFFDQNIYFTICNYYHNTAINHNNKMLLILQNIIFLVWFSSVLWICLIQA